MTVDPPSTLVYYPGGVASPLTLVELYGLRFQAVARRRAGRFPLRVRNREAGFGFPDAFGFCLDADVRLVVRCDFRSVIPRTTRKVTTTRMLCII